MDEVSFWRDENSAMPDTETYSAVLPALLTTKGIFVGIRLDIARRFVVRNIATTSASTQTTH